MKNLSKRMAMIALAVAGAGLPVVSASAQERDRVQYREVARDDMPRPVRHEADRQARDARDVKYQRQTRDGKTFYSVHFTSQNGRRMEVRLDEEGKVVDGPHEARDQSSGDSSRDRDRDRNRDDSARPAAENDDRNVEFHGISARNVQREVPRDVLRTLDQHTKNGKDLFYQRQVRNGKTFYSVHYTTDDNKRMFVRVDERGQVAVGPQESQASERNAANPDYGRDRSGSATADAGRRGSDENRASSASDANVKREAISADDLPAEVRRTVEQTMANGGGHAFIRETRGNEVSYVVEYIVGEQRTSARVAADGKVLQASPLSGTATAQRQPTNPTPTPAAGQNTPQPAQSSAEPQLAAAREAAPYGVIGADQLPSAVRTAVEQNAPGGSSDMLIQRFSRQGQTLYSVHFTHPEGRRMFMALDQSGKPLVEPRKSNWQEGGKGVRFELVGADQLPAEVRQQIQQQGGSEHLFLARTGENGKRTYLVQYTATDGERMEFQTDEAGKLTEKPRRAHEQPFTILERRGDDGDDRGDRKERRERNR